MKNTFIEELKKYERKALDTWLTKDHLGKGAGGANLKQLIGQVVELKKRLASFRPLLSDDIVVAFESLLWHKNNLNNGFSYFWGDSSQDVQEDSSAYKSYLSLALKKRRKHKCPDRLQQRIWARNRTAIGRC